MKLKENKISMKDKFNSNYAHGAVLLATSMLAGCGGISEKMERPMCWFFYWMMPAIMILVLMGVKILKLLTLISWLPMELFFQMLM